MRWRSLAGFVDNVRRQAAERKAAEEYAWAQSNIAACASPMDDHACDGVRGFVRQYPNSPHGQDANGALSTFAEKLRVYKEKRAEEEAWKATGSEGCATAQTETACDGVKLYVERYPAGLHAAEAKAAEEKGTPGIEAAIDRRRWADAKPDTCLAGETDDACGGVEQYLAVNPVGAHAVEAKDVLDKGKAKIDTGASFASGEGAHGRLRGAVRADLREIR